LVVLGAAGGAYALLRKKKPALVKSERKKAIKKKVTKNKSSRKKTIKKK